MPEEDTAEPLISQGPGRGLEFFSRAKNSNPVVLNRNDLSGFRISGFLPSLARSHFKSSKAPELNNFIFSESFFYVIDELVYYFMNNLSISVRAFMNTINDFRFC